VRDIKKIKKGKAVLKIINNSPELFFENKIYSNYKKAKADQVIHPESLILKKDYGKGGKYRKGDHFLDNF
jgi:hypothetical protein